MTPERLRRRALALGAELEIDGRKINAGRANLRVVAPRPAEADPKPTAAPTSPSRDKADVLLDLLAAQAAVNQSQGETLGRVLADITGRLEPKIVEKEVQAKRVQPVAIFVVRDDQGRASELNPIYGDVGDAQMIDLHREHDERGLLSAIVPEYQ